MTTPLRVGVVGDLREERWPSMDLVADMLLDRLQAEFAGRVSCVDLRRPMARRFSRAPLCGATWPMRTADRLLNRLVDYPRSLGRRARGFDVVHIVDHSYSQLVHAVPEGRAVVTCHDLDTFRSLLAPDAERRSAPFRAMTRRILAGFRRAARITCDSAATRDEILGHDLVPADRLVIVPNAAHPACSPEPDAEADVEAARLLGAAGPWVDVLHVGSTIPRKRIDRLLTIVASVRSRRPEVRLVRAGGALTEGQADLARRLKIIDDAIVSLPFLTPRTLAAVYRRAALLLQPSDREGFGLPVVESLATGTPVVASDLPVLREAGGSAAEYCAPDDLASWTGTIDRLLTERDDDPAAAAQRRGRCLQQARRFSWSAYASQMVGVYEEVAGMPNHASPGGPDTGRPTRGIHLG
jgi:glycosyltransferase involved in cell wall biosynthesis